MPRITDHVATHVASAATAVHGPRLTADERRFDCPCHGSQFGLDGAVLGFGAETGLHMLRIIVGGVFDKFPNLKFIVGHTGEALPFWLYRMDYMQGAGQRSGRYPFMPKLQHPVSHYMKHNVFVTSSGVAWQPAIEFCQKVLGVERVMYAMDYPYQFVADEVAAMDKMTMSAEDKKMFFQTNAETVFKIRSST